MSRVRSHHLVLFLVGNLYEVYFFAFSAGRPFAISALCVAPSSLFFAKLLCLPVGFVVLPAVPAPARVASDPSAVVSAVYQPGVCDGARSEVKM